MKGSDSPVFFGEWLKQRRSTLDLTQTELAQRVGCSVFAVRKIESGERRPSKQLARLLAQVLQLPPEEQDIFVRVARSELSVERLVTCARDSDIEPSTIPPALTSPSAPSTNLPVSLTPMVGREPELAALDRLLRDPLCRLLTLFGTGGIGKTRLAIEFATRHQTRFADGVWFVPLASLRSSAFLVEAIANAVGLSPQGHTDPRSQLIHHLQEKQTLLVLDNVEHLLDGVELFAEILACAPHSKLIATSRVRLNLQNEWVYVVQGLPVPPADKIERAEEYASIQLFVRSAQRALTGFRLQVTDRQPVARICALVEGMPLGIELAAAWVTTLTCREIADEIEHSLDFLTTSAHGVPERQRSLRAVFDHSWNLLSEEEQAVLGRLSIFQGGFARDAATQVAGATLLSLHGLIAKSLLRHDENGRYDLHEVVRQYASARFARDPAYAMTCDKHSAFYLSQLSSRERDLKGAAQRAAIQSLKMEIDNLRAAWAWAVKHEQFDLIRKALRSFGWLCNIGVLYHEGISQLKSLERVLRTGPENEERRLVLGMALAQQGLLYFRQGHFDQAVAAYEESLALHRPLGDPALLTDALIVSGVIAHLNGDLDLAQARLNEGLACAQLAEDESFVAYALHNFGYVASLKGHYHEGYEQMKAGLAIWRELGDPSAIALGLNYISPTAIRLGHIQEAKAYLLESLDLLAQVGERWGMGTAYRHLGLVALAMGDPAQAQIYIRQSLDLFCGIITGWDVARSLACLGMATAAGGDLCEARDIYLQALHEAKECRATPLTLDVLGRLAQIYLRDHEGETALRLALYAANHTASTYEVTEEATMTCAEAEATLTTGQIDAAKTWVANHTLEDVVDLLLAGSICSATY